MAVFGSIAFEVCPVVGIGTSPEQSQVFADEFDLFLVQSGSMDVPAFCNTDMTFAKGSIRHIVTGPGVGGDSPIEMHLHNFTTQLPLITSPRPYPPLIHREQVSTST